MNPTTSAVTNISVLKTPGQCGAFVEQSTAQPCKWQSTHLWAYGTASSRIFVAVENASPQTVEFILVSFPGDANLRRGLSVCNIFQTRIPRSWSEEDRFWCEQEANLRPLDFALRRITKAQRQGTSADIRAAFRIYKTLTFYGGRSGVPSHVFPWAWAKVVHADNLTVAADVNQGIHGYLQFFPAWLCHEVQTPEARTGCYQRAVSEFDGDCDSDTSVGCECDPSSFEPTPALECVDVPGSSGMFHTSVHSQGGQARTKIAKGKVGKPEDCDWNPFTNLPYFLFCIILKILKPIITAVFFELPHVVKIAPALATPQSLLQLTSELNPRSVINNYNFQVAHPKKSTATSMISQFRDLIRPDAGDVFDTFSGSIDAVLPPSTKRKAKATAKGPPAFFDSPRSMHGHAAVPVDWGRGVLVFGGCATPDNATDAAVGMEYFSDVWWYRVGFDQTQRRIRWFGHMWLPAHVRGTYPTPRAFHSLVSVGEFHHPGISNFQTERTVVLFGGFDGRTYFDDVFAILHTQQSLLEVSALRNATTSVAVDDLTKRRSQTFFFAEGEAKCNAKHMSEKTTNSSDERKGARFCLAQHALPWHGEPFYRTSGSTDKGGSPWLHAPRWVGPLSTQGQCTARARHATVVVGDNQLMVVYGGEGSHGLLGDVCILILAGPRAGTWRTGQPASGATNDPTPRAGHAMVALGPRVYVYGGFGTSAGLFDDLLALDVSGCKQFYSASPGPDPMDCRFVTHGPGNTVSTVMRWRSVRSLGSGGPVGRFGHQMVLALKGLQLAVVGGFGGSGTHSNWRQHQNEIGKRNDVWVIDLHVPNVTRVWPSTVSPTSIAFPASQPDVIALQPSHNASSEFRNGGLFVVDGTGFVALNESGLAPARIFIEGAYFGSPCTTFSASGSNGIPRCNASCDESSCNTSTWRDNNIASGVRVLIGERECSHVSWFSPQLLSCEVPPGVGANLDVRVLANGQATPKGNALFNYAKPVIDKVVPPFLMDYPGVARGPFQIWGKNFGFSREYKPNTGSSVATIPVANSSTSNVSVWIGNQRCLATRQVSDQLLVCLCVDRKGGREGMTSGLVSVTVNVGGQWADLPKSVQIMMAPESLERYFEHPEQLSDDVRAAKTSQNVSLSPAPAASHFTVKFPEGVACPDPSDEALADLFSGTNLTQTRNGTTQGQRPPRSFDAPAADFQSAQSAATVREAAQSSVFSSAEATRKTQVVSRGKDADAALRARTSAVIFVEQATQSSRHHVSTDATVGSLVEATRRVMTSWPSLNSSVLPSAHAITSAEAACSLVPFEGSSNNKLDISRFSWDCASACGTLFETAAQRGAVRQEDISPKCKAVMELLAWQLACNRQSQFVETSCRHGMAVAACAALRRLVDTKCNRVSGHSRSASVAQEIASASNAIPAHKFLEGVSGMLGVVATNHRDVSSDTTTFRFMEEPFAIHIDGQDVGRNASGASNAPSTNAQPAAGDDVLLVDWLPDRQACKVGKPPLPRRDFTMTPIAGRGVMLGSNTTKAEIELGAVPSNSHWFRSLELGGDSFVVFGGRGVNSGIRMSEYENQTENAAKRPTEHDINYWSSSKPLPEVDFNDTFLLLDLFATTTAEKAQLGVEEGGTCPAAGGTVRGTALLPPGVVGSAAIWGRQQSSPQLMTKPDGYPEE